MLGTMALTGLTVSPAEAQTLSETTDPSDAIPGYLDIRRVWVERLSSVSVRFCMELREPIPAQPANYTAYIWFVDADQNPNTGQVFADIGPDRNIRVASGGEPWAGYVDYVTESDCTGGLPVHIHGNRLSLTLPLTEKGGLGHVN
jgi:hypothetical protein